MSIGRGEVSRYSDRIRSELTAAFSETYTPNEIAVSFAIGIFVTALPTGGLGIGVLLALCYWWPWMSKTAAFAAVIVLNPLVKPAVYVASYQIGGRLLGAEPVVVTGDATLSLLLTLVQFILLGNVIIALALSAGSYVTIYHLTCAYRNRNRFGHFPSFHSSDYWPFRRR